MALFDVTLDVLLALDVLRALLTPGQEHGRSIPLIRPQDGHVGCHGSEHPGRLAGSVR